MDKLWKSKIIGRATKVRIFISNVKAVLVYASESWDIYVENNKQSTSSLSQYLHKTVNVHWPNKISNNDLWTKTDQERALIQIKRPHIEKK